MWLLLLFFALTAASAAVRVSFGFPWLVKLALVLVMGRALILSMKTLPLTWGYIITTFYACISFAGVVGDNFIYPYLLSPRRFYAGLLGTSGEHLWRPPGDLSMLIAKTLILFGLYYTISIVTVKLISLKRCKKENASVTSSRGYQIAFVAFMLHVFFTNFPFLTTFFRMLPLPFIKKLAVGIPVGIVSSMLLVWVYEPKICKDVCNKTLNKDHLWKDVA